MLVRVIKNKFSNVSYTLNGTYRLIMINLTTCTWLPYRFHFIIIRQHSCSYLYLNCWLSYCLFNQSFSNFFIMRVTTKLIDYKEHNKWAAGFGRMTIETHIVFSPSWLMATLQIQVIYFRAHLDIVLVLVNVRLVGQ